MADFTLNAPGATNNPWTPANIIVPVSTIRSDTTGWRASATGVFDSFAHNVTYGSTITTTATIASGAASNGDEIWIGAVVRSGTNAGAGLGIAYTAFGIQVISWDKTGAETTISANKSNTRANSDTVSCTVAIVGSTATISATINGTAVVFSGATTTSALTSETTLAAGCSFDPQNNNSLYLGQMTGTGVMSGTFVLNASNGAFTVVGENALIPMGTVIQSAFGAYTIGGQAATFLQGPANFTLLGSTGNFALLGAPSSSAYALFATPGSYAFLGSDAGLGQLTSYNLVASNGAFALSGQAVNQNYVITANFGQFTLAGQAVNLLWPQGGLVDPGNLVYKRVFVISPSGSMRPWVDYLPVEFLVVTAAMADRYDFNGALAVKALSSVTGLVPWVDYLPVATVSGTHTWTTDDSTGYIPMVKLV